MSSTLSPLLFKTAAILFALLIPGHVLFGAQSVHPALARARSKPALLNQAQLQGTVGARNTWDSWNVSTAGIALLHYHYATTAGGVGPQTQLEKLALAAFAVANLVSGLRYGKNGVIGPAVGLVLASSASLAGLALL